MGNDRLHDCGEREAENQRPQDFPSHGERHAERTQDRFRHRPLPCPLEPSKSNTIKIVLIETTRDNPYLPAISAPPFDMYGNNTPNAANPDKRQNQMGG